MVEGLCHKCKKLVEMVNQKKKVTKNGLDYVLGNCPVCSLKVSRILGKSGKGDY